MKKALSLFVFLILATVTGRLMSSPVDSIELVLKLTKDPLAKAGLINLQSHYLIAQNPQLALSKNKAVFDILSRQRIKEDDSLYLEALFARALYFSKLQQNDSVIFIQNHVHKTSLAKGFQTIAAKSIAEEAIAQESLGNYQSALEGYFTALQIFEEIADQKGVLHQCTNLGLIYQYQKKYKRAETFFLRALQISHQLNFKEGVITAYNNLGINYEEQKNYSEALNYFNKVLEYDLSQHDSINIGDSYNNIGVVYVGLKDFKKAEKYFQISLKYKESQNDLEGISNTYNNLAETYLKQGKPNIAFEYINKAEGIAKPNKLKVILKENYRIATDYYKQIGDYKGALLSYERLIAMQDSLKLDELSIRIEQVQKQYETEKSEKEIIQKDKELAENESNQQVLVMLITFFFLVVVIMMLSVVKSRKLNNQLRKQKHLISEKNSKLQEQILATNQAKELAEEAAQAKSQFLSTMSHEIRTPLNAVIGLANLLAENNPREDQKENISVLQNSSVNLLAILNDVLDLSKMEAGKMEIESVEFSVKNTIKTVYDLYANSAKQKSLSLLIDVDKSIPDLLQGDSLHLNQILSNLVSNAIKFTHTGYVKITAKITKNSNELCSIQFKVDDTGIGIPADKIDAIFDVFTQADTNTTRKYGGTGLGLAICKKLLQLQNSKLVVKSELGVGSIFSFELTFNKSNQDNKSHNIKVMEQAITNLQGVKLLVADDNQINVFVIKQFLTNWGVNIAIAENGEEAVKLASTQDFDVILMDLHMPVMDGFEATKEIMKIKPNSKIIAITATTEDEVGGGITDAGMVGFVMKPFQPEDLAAKINAALGR